MFDGDENVGAAAVDDVGDVDDVDDVDDDDVVVGKEVWTKI